MRIGLLIILVSIWCGCDLVSNSDSESESTSIQIIVNKFASVCDYVFTEDSLGEIISIVALGDTGKVPVHAGMQYRSYWRRECKAGTLQYVLWSLADIDSVLIIK